MLKWHSRALAAVLQETSVAQGLTDGTAGVEAAAGQSGLRATIHLQLWLQTLGCASSVVPQTSPLHRALLTSNGAHIPGELSDTSIACFTGEHLPDVACLFIFTSSLLFTPLSHSESVQHTRFATPGVITSGVRWRRSSIPRNL